MLIKFLLSQMVLVMFLSVESHAQNFSIDIEDNGGLQMQVNNYHITQDSLVIKAKSDYGRTHVDYLQRKLTNAEKKELSKFVTAFNADSLKQTYFNEYSNFDYITADHFPRVIDVSLSIKSKIIQTKATNAYVFLLAELFDQINKLLPSEVGIRYDKNNFNAMY